MDTAAIHVMERIVFEQIVPVFDRLIEVQFVI
jgi:hypothetical protein